MGRITTAGVIAEFPLPAGNTFAAGIAVGSDGALWFTETGFNQIGRITTAGTVTEFAVPSANFTLGGIAAGPDGALWFAEYLAGKIGRITTAGSITEYPLPAASRRPYQIASGPDGALWFTRAHRQSHWPNHHQRANNRVSCPYSGCSAGPNRNGSGWCTVVPPNKPETNSAGLTAGVITEFPLPTAGVSPFGITWGPDGALWFSEYTGSSIGRALPAPVITEFPIPTPNSATYGITAGPDGAVWFAEALGGKIGRITTGGSVTEYPVPGGAPIDLALARRDVAAGGEDRERDRQDDDQPDGGDEPGDRRQHRRQQRDRPVDDAPVVDTARIPSTVPKHVASSRAKKAIDRLTGRRCMTLSATGMWVNHELPRSPCRQSAASPDSGRRTGGRARTPRASGRRPRVGRCRRAPRPPGPGRSPVPSRNVRMP